ncbi:MAG: GNAT family N-acetyltransferase [Planctomycetota bacterium]
MIAVRPIAADQTHDLRHRILRAHQPPEAMVYDGDEEQTSRHFGAFDSDQLVGIATLHRRPMRGSDAGHDDLQLRGMAVDDSHRGTGVGRLLLEACLDHAGDVGAPRLWCNARISATQFYLRMGMQQRGDRYDVPDVGPHVLMVIELDI